jgi:hypothetical protein
VGRKGWARSTEIVESQQTEKIETEVRDVDRMRIRESVRMLSRMVFWGVIRALQSDINIYYPHCLQLPTIK